MTNQSNQFGTKVKELREKHQMTQTDLAQKLNVSKSVISAYEKGIRSPSFKVLKDICEVFGISESEFLVQATNETKILIDITDLTVSQQRIIYALLNEFRAFNDEQKQGG